MNDKIDIFEGDLPFHIYIDIDNTVQIDVELWGKEKGDALNYQKGKLCLVQIKEISSFETYFVKFDISKPYNAPYLTLLLEDENITKLAHYPQVDLCYLANSLNCRPQNILCTKVAANIVLGQGPEHKHSLANLCKNVLGIELDKHEQMSDWSVPQLSESQIKYAQLDVEYLDPIWDTLIESAPEKEDIIRRNCQFYPQLIANILSGKPNLNGFPLDLLEENQKLGIKTQTLFEYTNKEELLI